MLLPRSCVLAATVISHGELWATLLAPTVSPELPAEVETKTPACGRVEEGELVGVTMEVRGAGDRVVDHVDAVGDSVVDRGHDAVGAAGRADPSAFSHSTLYMAMRAAGAMPEVVPTATPLIMAGDAVVAGGRAGGVRAVAVVVTRASRTPQG